MIKIFGILIQILASWHDQAADIGGKQITELVDEVPQPYISLLDELLLLFRLLLGLLLWVFGWPLAI